MRINNNNVLFYNSTGLAVTGTLSATSDLRWGNGATTGAIVAYGTNTGGGLALWTDSSAGNSIGWTGETGAYNSYIGTVAATSLSFATNSTVRMTLDASGNLGIGTSSPATKLNIGAGGVLRLNRSDNATYGDISYGGAGIGLLFNDANSEGYSFRLGGTDKMRLDSSGNLLVGVTSAIASGSTIFNSGSARQVLTLKGDNSGSYTQGIWSATTTGDNLFTYFGTETSLSVRGSISYNRSGGLTVYSTTSDYRLKENIIDLPNALETVSRLKPRQFDWKETGNTTTGFIAHELAEVCPHAVTGEKDAVDEDGNPKYQGIDTSFLVATLTAAIQEQQAIITALTTRVTALEAK
jgi:hypothetical protein